MRAAPPVLLACGPDPRTRAGMAVLVALSAGTLAGWLCWRLGAHPGYGLSAAALAAVVAAALADRHAARGPMQQLAWDGRAWQLDGTAGRIDLALDAGRWLLVSWRSGAQRRWLSIWPAHCGAPAHLVRAALCTHATRARPPAADGLGRHG